MHTHVPSGGLAKQLKFVHDMLRRDLATVRGLADEVTAGAGVEEVQAQLVSLQANGPLWHMRVNCLRYCGIVHMHHSLESAELFPALRRSNPALDPVIDKLEADHLHVSGQLDEVSAACEAFSLDVPASRNRLINALQALSTDLLAHLAYEEEQISTTLNTWSHWP